MNIYSQPTHNTIWCDMDGVIAVYDPDGFKSTPPRFLIKNGHYFASCEPDNRIIDAIKILYDAQIQIRIISNVARELSYEHSSDKRKWCREHLSFMGNNYTFDAIIETKAAYVQKKLHRHLNSSDVLISDFNEDLVAWRNAGGTAVKYLNGINSPDSFNGIQLPSTSTPPEIAASLLTIFN